MGANISNQIEIRRLRHTLPVISLADLHQLTETYPDHVYFFMDDIVIDATQFVNSHPGGDAALQKRHMCDITDDYKWHSAKGKRMILSFARWRWGRWGRWAADHPDHPGRWAADHPET